MENPSEKLSVQDVANSMQNFGTIDYAIFALMLASCCGIGIYFGFVKKQSGADAYLVGGRNMKTLPVSFSLIASFISGISLLGYPTEIYVYGTSYMSIGFGIVLVGFAMSYVFLPIFHDLQLTTAYEYLERRFDNRVRIFACVLFAIGLITWLPIVIYVPALAFNQVTGVSLHVVTPFVCAICIFYTCVGGLKAVVWSDFIQTFIMFGAMILIAVKGTIEVGGIRTVLARNLESGRLEMPSLDLNLTIRHTAWSLVLGGSVLWLQISGVNQIMIQRYLALPTLKSARRALWSFIVGVLLLLGLCGYAGLLAYGWYHDCDPLSTKLARAKDQLLPLLMMNILKDLPGLPGLFVAGVFSAALSSLSTGLNSMAAVILEDFIKPFKKKPFSPRATDILMKVTVLIFGIICTALVYVVERAGTHVLQLTTSLSSIQSGPLLGIFNSGILLPWVNSKGALVGGISGLGFMAYMVVSAEAAMASGSLQNDQKPVNTNGCTYSFPAIINPLMPSSNPNITENIEEPWAIYRISYLWYTSAGFLVTVGVALIVSAITSADLKKCDPALIAPFMRRFIKKSRILEVNTLKDVKLSSKFENHQQSNKSPSALESL